jgi:hypothetical protein
VKLELKVDFKCYSGLCRGSLWIREEPYRLMVNAWPFGISSAMSSKSHVLWTFSMEHGSNAV